MNFGMYLPTEGEFSDPRLVADLAVEAEAGGWDGFFVWDELLPVFDASDAVRRLLGDAGDVADAFVTLAAVAARTQRIRFGALVTPVARVRPEALARQAATLDRLSGGRLVLGVGLGSPAEQFSRFGLESDLRVRAGMVDELLEVVTALWTGRPVEHRGEHYVVDSVAMTPPPLQHPRIPVWIGGEPGGGAARRRAARWDGFVPAGSDWPHGMVPAAGYRSIAADIAAARPSDAPFDLVVIGDASASLPGPAVRDEYRRAGVTWMLAQAFTVDEARRCAGQGPPGQG